MRPAAKHLVLAAALAAAMGGAAHAAPAKLQTTPDGATPLMQAVYEGDVVQTKRLLAGHANVNASNAYGVNAMLLAAEASNTQLIDMLLKAGAKATSANPDGETALHLVARSGNVENPEEEEIESLCELLTTVGGLLDTPKARAHLDVYFSRMNELCKSNSVGSRMQFMLQVCRFFFVQVFS